MNIDLIEAQMKFSHALLDALEDMSEEEQKQVIKDFASGLQGVIVENAE